VNTESLQRLAPTAGSKLLIVGGCGGIGRCLIAAALENDLEVMVLDLESSLEATELPPDVHSFGLDASCRESVVYAMQDLGMQWGHLDGLVNLAGFMGEPLTVDRSAEAIWEDVFDASYRTTLNVCRSALPLLRQSTGHPSIVNMSSGMADVCNPGYGAYSSAKAAIVALTKTIARENAPAIRCNAVAPGGINTPFLTGGTGRTPVSRRLDEEAYLKLVPMGRMGEAEDVAGPILFLLSDAARYMTGQVLYIDGGALMPA